MCSPLCVLIFLLKLNLQDFGAYRLQSVLPRHPYVVPHSKLRVPLHIVNLTSHSLTLEIPPAAISGTKCILICYRTPTFPEIRFWL